MKNGKMQILAHKVKIIEYLKAGCMKKYIYNLLVREHGLNITYRFFTNLINQEIMPEVSKYSASKPKIKSPTKINVPSDSVSEFDSDDLQQEIYDAVKGDYDQVAWAEMGDD